jgi:deoxycytidine triphosphate deaminase
VGVYCRAITEELGEIRIHYAGFVHPFFGANNVNASGAPKGTPLIFEVRGHNVEAILRNGDTLAKIKYYRMSEGYEEDSDDYGDQELRLSKVFNDWPE